MNLLSLIGDGSLVIIDNAASCDRLLKAKGCFNKISLDSTDHKVEVNLNSINSFHSMINEFYRGVATKYINRYASLFSFAWKYYKFEDNDMFETIRELLVNGK